MRRGWVRVCNRWFLVQENTLYTVRVRNDLYGEDMAAAKTQQQQLAASRAALAYRPKTMGHFAIAVP